MMAMDSCCPTTCQHSGYNKAERANLSKLVTGLSRNCGVSVFGVFSGKKAGAYVIFFDD